MENKLNKNKILKQQYEENIAHNIEYKITENVNDMERLYK